MALTAVVAAGVAVAVAVAVVAAVAIVVAVVVGEPLPVVDVFGFSRGFGRCLDVNLEGGVEVDSAVPCGSAESVEAEEDDRATMDECRPGRA